MYVMFLLPTVAVMTMMSFPCGSFVDSIKFPFIFCLYGFLASILHQYHTRHDIIYMPRAGWWFEVLLVLFFSGGVRFVLGREYIARCVLYLVYIHINRLGVHCLSVSLVP